MISKAVKGYKKYGKPVIVVSFPQGRRGGLCWIRKLEGARLVFLKTWKGPSTGGGPWNRPISVELHDRHRKIPRPNCLY